MAPECQCFCCRLYRTVSLLHDARDFDHVDVKGQAHIYDAMREYGKCLPWALQNDGASNH